MNIEVRQLLSEAAEWRLLGLLFEYPGPGWRGQVQALRSDLEAEELRGLGEAALDGASEGLHLALFGPGGVVPVREVTYRGGVQLGYLMAELEAYYEAFGYRPALEEAADHLAVELGFVAFLKMKQACAVAEGREEMAEMAAEAAAQFVRDHLAAMAEPVARGLAIFAPQYLAEAGAIVVERAGPAPRSSYPLGSVVTEDEQESSEFACGAAPSGKELVQLEP